MYCPNCGSNNQPQIKFCRICGTGLEVVSAALAANAEGHPPQKSHLAALIKNYHSARHKMMFGIGSLALGVGLLAILLLGGHVGFFWIFLWVFMGLFGNGIHQFQKGWRDWSEASSELKALGYQKPPTAAPLPEALPQEYREPLPDSRTTGALADSDADRFPPPSITESTTRHLDIKKPE
jgi:hypothetical protein